MIKLLECPVCHKHIHTLKGKIPCSAHGDFCIDVDGVVAGVDIVHDYTNSIEYSCPHCGYAYNVLNAFIRDVYCECEHDTLTVIVHDDTQMDICEHCGLVVSSESVEVGVIEPD